MKTNDYVVNKLTQVMPEKLKSLLYYMKDNGGMYVAGGAITHICVGKHEEINDFDCFFPTVEACVKAIRWMKEENPHVAFVSDKSITYKLGDASTIQFVYNNFYPEANDIFKTFDFTIVMGAYDCRDWNIYTHENFWMHNAQKFLSFNKGTSFPILSLLRVDKYKSRGYKTSRNEMLKLSLAVSQLNIDSWEKAEIHLGNTYGFTLADFDKVKETEFTIDALLERIEMISDGDNIPMQTLYKYPHNAVDFLLEGNPIEYVLVGEEKNYIDPLVIESEDGVESLIEDGYLRAVEVEKEIYTSGTYYAIYNEKGKVGDVVKPNYYESKNLYRKDNLDFSWNDKGKVVFRVDFDLDDIKNIYNDYLVCNKFTLAEIICRVEDIDKFKNNEPVSYRPNAKMVPESLNNNGWAFTENEEFQRGKITQLKDMRHDFIKSHVIIVDKTPRYAHTTFKGVIVQGGESIKAEELLYFMDDWNLCFGGSISIKEDGTFSGRYNTD